MTFEEIDIRASSYIYKIDENIVHKGQYIFVPPESNASSEIQLEYAEETIYHSAMMKNELTIYRVLQHYPHPNVIDIIEINYDGGFYLHKYQTYSDIAETPTQAMRILWYRDILRALASSRPRYHPYRPSR